MTHSNHIRILFAAFDRFGKNDFHRWHSAFTSIHGRLDTQRKIDVPELEELYSIDIKSEDDVFKLIYCLETYYTIVLRLLAYRVVFGDAPVTHNIFNVDYFNRKGIANYTCSKLYNWFIDVYEINGIYDALLKEIESKYLSNLGFDFIKEIFESIFPTQVRHSMGEFYTPDWLAEFVIKTLVEKDKDAATRKYLDPACGSGTFLFNAIKKFGKESGGEILENVYGIDINPVSVLAAKTNYLLQYSLHRNFNGALTIPIYHADTINSPFPSDDLFTHSERDEYDELSIPKVDYIIGNPPWVNWEYLPNEYRAKTIQKWKHYNLFNVHGMEAGFIKEDISVLLTYVALDRYLKDNGQLGFVVKETLFKSIKHGEGFRRFYIAPSKTPLNPYRVDDLTAFRPFNGAINRSALLFMRKGEHVQYPVDYYYWETKTRKKRIPSDLSVDQIDNCFNFVLKKAKPSVRSNPLSGWIAVESNLIDKLDTVLGENDYKARTGVFTGGANGIYWLEAKNTSDLLIEASNITDKAKNKVKNVTKKVEKTFVYPFLTGKELGFWSYKYTKYILVPHTKKTKMYPVEKSVLAQFPKTMAYFEMFKKELQARKGFTSFDKHIHNEYYYALQRIGEYTFAPYKVAWRYISKQFTPAVIEHVHDKLLGYRNVIPNEKIIIVGFDDSVEAYYLCGILSSTLYRQAIESYMVSTQVAPGTINRLYIPKFSGDEEAHIQISKFCNAGHRTESEEERKELIAKIDRVVDQMLSAPRYKAMHVLPGFLSH